MPNGDSCLAVRTNRNRQVKVPMLIMPSGEDPDHLPLKEVLDKKPFGDKCQYRRFDDMHHGFCAGRWVLSRLDRWLRQGVCSTP